MRILKEPARTLKEFWEFGGVWLQMTVSCSMVLGFTKFLLPGVEVNPRYSALTDIILFALAPYLIIYYIIEFIKSKR